MKKQLNEITSAQKHVEGWLLTNEDGDPFAVVKSGDNLADRVIEALEEDLNGDIAIDTITILEEQFPTRLDISITVRSSDDEEDEDVYYINVQSISVY